MKSNILKYFGLVSLFLAIAFGSKAESLKISDFTITGGQTSEVEVEVNVSSGQMFDYIGFQFDLFLPEGLMVESASLAQSLSDFILQQKNYGNGVYRFMGFSGSATPANSKAIVNLTLKASETTPSGNAIINIQNVVFSAANGQDIKLDNSTSTANVFIQAKGIEVSLAPGSESTILIGQTSQLIATVTPENATDKSVNWNSETPGVATVSNNGLVTGIGVGTATITATNSAGQTSSILITVNPIVASGVTLNVQDMTLLVGQTDKLTVTVTPENTTDKTITWKSENEAVATVGTDGTVTAVSVGVANITATCGDATAACKVTVNPVVASGITLNVQDMTLLVGQTDKLTATVTPENTTDKTITWESDNEAVATVGTDGTVTAVSVGVANITATCGEVSATCKVTVNPVVASGVTLNVQDMTLLVGQTDKLTATVTPENTTDQTITWKSDNEAVATVDTDGTVTAISVGVANITATCGEVSATCKVTVNPVVASGVTLNVQDMTLLVGQTDKLTATVTPENTTDKTITWKSDHEVVATISNDGTVTALATGVATITASCGEVSATCQVTVKGADDVTVKPGDGTHGGDDDDTPGNNTENGGSLIGNNLTLRVNQTAAIELEIPEGLSVEPRFAWTLDNGGAEFVSMTIAGNTLSATFQGLKVGQTGYTVSIVGVNGNIEAVKGKITVIAEFPMTSLRIEPASISLAQNALPVQLSTVVTPDNASMKEFSWESSVPTVATISQTGELKPVSQGKTVITATALDGSQLSAISNVTVTAPIDDNFEFEFDESVMGGKEGISLYIGETYTFTPKAQDGYVLPDVINWTSTVPETVSVDSNGKITALKLGQSTVTASATVNGKEVSASCEVTVLPIALTSVVVSAQTSTTLRDGETVQLKATTSPSNATGPISIVWRSDDNEVATVDSSTGLVTAHAKVGKATITATANNPAEKEVKGTIEINVVPTGANRVLLNVYDLTMLIGQKESLTASVEPDNTTDKAITWTSNNPSVAEIDTEGNITALSVGTATITATCGEATATCTVTVKGGGDITVTPGDGTPGSKDEDDGDGWIEGNDVYVHVNRTVNMKLTMPDGLTQNPTLTWKLADGGEQYVEITPAEDTFSAAFKGLEVGKTSYTISLDGKQLITGKVTVIAEVPMKSLALDPATLTMAQNALPQTIKPVYTPQNASMPEFNWTSSVPTVATVDQNGKVGPVGQGQTIITATALDGSSLSATCEVTVTEPIDENFEFDFDESVMGGKEGISLYIGDTYTFTPKAKEGYVLPDIINWSTSDNTTVSVTDGGLVTALKLGKATITASATVNDKEVKATCEVTVIPILANKVVLSTEDLILLVGQTDKLTATVTPENTTDKTITWNSDNEAVAIVGTGGTVTALATGIANITATCGEATATCKVTVYGPEDVTVKPGDGTSEGDEDDTPGNNTENGGSLVGSDVTLRVNQLATIDLVIPEGLSVDPKFAWSLDNGGAEFVSMTVKANTLSATFKGLKVGNTGYTVSIVGVNGNIEAVKGKITVIAEIPMTSLELDPASITMAQNALPQTIKPIYNPQNASMPEFNWTSSVPTVATVDQDGKVTPVGQGQTLITCTALDGSGLSATSTVTVTAPIDEDFGFDESVMGGVEGVTIYIGDNYTLVPKAHDGYRLPENIVWSSSDDKTVSVDRNGKVTGLALGSATISATATINGKEITATCTVTVIPIKVSTIELSQTTAELRATETLTLTATIGPDNATNKSLQWTTNAPSIATVSQEGVVTAHMVGEANITARALDGSNVTASCIVKVVPTIATGISVKAEGSTSIKATETVQLTATVTPETTTDKSVTWRSDKPAIATVNNSGVVTGVAVGEATITATNSAGQTADIKIIVVPTPVEAIELNRYSAQIKVQDGFQLTANILPLTATNKAVSWTSSAPEIVSVDAEGNVLALSLGNATITCEAQDGSGVKAECQIMVTTTATQSVSITAEGSTTLKAKETVQLKATVLPATASDKSVRWQSANPDVATVDNTGLVTAVSVGTVQITATNSGGQSASVTITVIPTQVESIKLNKTSATLKSTETLALIATVNPETATDKSLEWASDNESVATVNQNGVVTAIATGEAIITVKAKDGSNVTATCKVNVIATEVTSITITANRATTLKASENVQLIATILPETATDKSVTWSASAPAIANVNENGLVTAYAVGESVITATASSGLTANITITVVPTPVANITLNRTTLTMRVGNGSKLTATIQPETATDKSVTWTSSNPEIATVNTDGNVTALLEGQTSIICTANDGSGISASCIVNVVDTDVETVTIIAEGSTTLKVSETVQLTATVMPETSTDKEITWSSGNEKVAVVDANGLVTAVSEGVAVITATTSNGLSDSITITVVETQVTSITLNETSIILQANETYSLIPSIYPQTATNKEVIWSSGNADIATVNQDGTVTAIMVGETSVTATAADGSGVTASCKVTVIPTTATSISITVHGETSLEINQTVQLTAEVLPENATDKTVAWSSSNLAIASVTETGLVTALSAGETVITATNSAGQYDRVTITVLSNEPDEPVVPEPVVTPADTPTQLLRKGDGTSHTFVAMMEKDDEVLEAEDYRYVFGYDNQTDGTAVIEDTPWRYTHTTEDIYWNSSNDFWVFAYYVDGDGKLHVSSRRHLDGSVDSDFNAADLIGGASRSGEHIIGIFTVDGQYVGKELNNLTNGIYIVRTSNSSYKIIK